MREIDTSGASLGPVERLRRLVIGGSRLRELHRILSSESFPSSSGLHVRTVGEPEFGRAILPTVRLMHVKFETLDEEIPATVSFTFTSAATVKENLEALRDFVQSGTDVTARVRPDPTPRRVTLVFVDLIQSTLLTNEEDAKEIWQSWSAGTEHIRHMAEQYRGRTVKLIGDGVLSAFDIPQDALTYARALIEDARESNLQVRAAVHFGEVATSEDRDMVDGDLVGRMANHVDPGGLVMTAEVLREVEESLDLKPTPLGATRFEGAKEQISLYLLH